MTGCRFCQDIGSRYLYDEELLLAIHEACARRGITMANATFVYSDPTRHIPMATGSTTGCPI